MKTNPDSFGLEIESLLRKFRDRINVRLNGEYCYIGSSTSEAFQFRAYAAVTARGRELAVTVDVKNTDSGISVVSDLCWDDGQLVVQGPAASIGATGIEGHSEVKLWIAQFDQFLKIAMTSMVDHAEGNGFTPPGGT